MKDIVKKRPVGRKCDYHEKVEPRFEEIKKWRKEGQTERNIAKLCGVSYRTFCAYKVKFPQLMQLLKDAKETLISELEDTLFRMALGKVKVTETKKYIQKDSKGNDKTRIEETVKDIAPHPTLLIFSLKNLAPDKWKDVQDVTFNDMENAIKNMDTVFAEMKDKLDKSDDTITSSVPE